MMDTSYSEQLQLKQDSTQVKGAFIILQEQKWRGNRELSDKDILPNSGSNNADSVRNLVSDFGGFPESSYLCKAGQPSVSTCHKTLKYEQLWRSITYS